MTEELAIVGLVGLFITIGSLVLIILWEIFK